MNKKIILFVTVFCMVFVVVSVNAEIIEGKQCSARVGINHLPTLSNGSVSPLSGHLDTVFKFNVTYTDVDNDTPVYVNVTIDGCVYEYSTSLLKGFHYYSFEASDGTDINRTVTIYGIKVTEKEEQKTWVQQVIYYFILIIIIITVEIVVGVIFLKKRKKTMTLKCPKCNTIFKVKRKKESFKVECPTCGAGGTIGKPRIEQKTLLAESVPKPKSTPSEISNITIRCPKCRQTFTVEVKEKPFSVKCPHCGKEGTIR